MEDEGFVNEGYNGYPYTHASSGEGFPSNLTNRSFDLPTMWRNRLAAAVNWVRSRRLVGEHGRHAFYAEFVASDVPEKRSVEYKDRDICDSSTTMPTEWWAWLHNRRDDPPTADEISASEIGAERLARRVKALEEEDARQRLRQFAGAAKPKEGGSEVRRERVKERLLRSANDKSAAANKPGGQQAGVEGEGTVEAFEPESWTPPSREEWRR